MNEITFPLRPRMQGPEVGDLQAALQRLLEQGVILRGDATRRRALAEELAEEFAAKTYGNTTYKVVSVFQETQQLEATGAVDEATANALNALWQITGNIFLEHGLPAERLGLRLYRHDFGGKLTKLAETTTLAGGRYAFSFDPGSTAASLEVRTVKGDQEIPLSKPLDDLGAETPRVLNLLAPGGWQPPAPEYRRLVSDLTPHVGEMKDLARASENGERRDLTVLHRATGWDARLIALAAMTERLAADADVQLPAEGLYGLLRAGLPSDKLMLARVDPDMAQNALEKLQEAGIVELTNWQIERFKEEFTRFANQVRLKIPTPGSQSTYGDLLKVSGLDDDAQAKFAQVYFTHRGDATDLWNKAREAGLDDGQVGRLRRQGKFAFLAGNSEAMTTRLMNKQITDPEELVDQDFHRAESWVEEILEQAGIPEDRRDNLTDDDKKRLDPMIPIGYVGDDTGDRLVAYAEDMARKIRLSYPTQVVTRLIETDKIRLPVARDATVGLLKDATQKGFRFGETPTAVFPKDSADLREGLSDAEFDAVRQNMKTLQRVYQITPSNEAMPVLMSLGMSSAYDVMAYSEPEFIALYERKYLELFDKMPPTAEARLILDKSRQVNSVTYNLFAIAKKLESESPINGMSPPVEIREEVREQVREELIKRFPTMESLFGSMDFCECEHCRSVLSPAAYLVDLLQFIDPESDQGKSGNAVSPYDVLVERRPDLPHIPLTCENTHTALPYIDIVNEILEYSVAHGKLAEAAARDTGGATTAELLAEPQNVIREAYDKLRAVRYPLALPFDLWLETVRRFCNYFETPLDEVLESLRQKDALFAPAQPYDRAAIFIESLGLSAAEAAIFTDADPLANNKWFDLYGFPTDQHTIQDPIVMLKSAKTLSRRLGVTYKEITEIVQTGFVNPRLVELNLLYKLGIDIRDARFYLDHKGLLERRLSTLSRDEHRQRREVEAFLEALERLAATYGVPAADLEAEIAAIPFDRVLLLADPDAGCNFDETTLRYANGDQADAIAFLKINLFVRLWRKLGWTIEETDRALQAFVPKDTPFEKSHLAKQPLKTALIYLAHLKKLDEKLKVGKESRLKLLTLWSDIATNGNKPLYAQLFLTPGVLKSDPVFDHPLGHYLSADWISIQAGLREYSAQEFSLLKGHLLTLQGALGLTADEIRQILEDAAESLDTAVLSLANVSLLYRYGLLAKALELSVQELIALKQLSGLDPFKPLHPEPLTVIEEDHPFVHTLRFIEIAEEVKESGLEIEDLEYLLRHRFDETGKYRPNPEGTLAQLKTLAEGVRAIRIEHAVPDDPGALSEELLRQKLGLVLPPDVAATFLAMMNGTLDQTQQQARSFFEQHLQKRTQPAGGFFEAADFDLLFDPDRSLAPDETEQERIRARNTKVAEAFLPFLQRRLIGQFIVRTIRAQTGADPVLVESLLTDPRLLALDGSRPLLDALSGTAERGLTVTFFAAPDGTDPALVTVTLPAADTGVEDKDGNPLKPADAKSACIEGYLEVPTPETYRFFVVLESENATAELRFDHLPEPVFLSGPATADNAVLDEQPNELLELKPGIPYRFTLELKDLNGGDAQLLVQGETLPKGSLSQLTLYPFGAIAGAQRAMLLLTKVLQLVQALGLSERELHYFTTHADAFDGLNLGRLPTTTGDDTPAGAETLFKQFLRLAGYARLKRDLAQGTDDLIGVFEANELETADKLEQQEVYPRIARLTRRDEATVKSAAEALFAQPTFDSEKPLQRLWQVLRISERFGVPVTSLLDWTRIVSNAATPEQRFEIARDLKEAIKARFEPETWQRVAQPIFDELRRRQRDALVSYLMHQRGFDRMEQLYEHFLIDPGMEPVVRTSRIRLAIASLQLFIQRSLLNLEPKVPPSAIDSKQWEWMKRYRVWEANRKIFLFPENWLEPEFRDDKTHLFAELEGALLQGDVSSDLVEDAFLAYLKQLDELARLDIVAMHIEDDSGPAPRTLHIIGRTFSQPHKYFYRRYAYQMWTPWEPVTAEIEGDHLAPVVWRDRLYLFWVTFMDKPDENAQPGTTSGESAGSAKLSDLFSDLMKVTDKKKVDIQLHWSEYLEGEWSTRQSSEFEPVVENEVPVTVPIDFDRRDVFIHVEVKIDGEKRGVYIYLGDKINRSFYLAGRNSLPELAGYNPAPGSPYGLGEVDATRHSGKGALKVSYRSTESEGPKEHPILENSVQSDGTYTVLPCNNIGFGVEGEIASLIRPVFYQDNRHTLFVEPTHIEWTIKRWPGWVFEKTLPEQGPWYKLPEELWDKPRVLPKFPHESPLPDPLIDLIDPASLIYPIRIEDQIVNPETVMEIDNVLIGPKGQSGIEIVTAGDDVVGQQLVSANPGSGLTGGSILVVNDQHMFAASGLRVTGGGLNIVGGAGFNSALGQ